MDEEGYEKIIILLNQMTPKQKVLVILILPVIIWFTLASFVTDHLMTKNSAMNTAIILITMLIMMAITIWLYSKLKTKEEIKEYKKVHTKIFNWGARFIGACFLIGGGFMLLSLLTPYGQPTLNMSEKIVMFFLILFVIIAGYGFLVAEEYKPRNIEPPDDSKSDKWCSQPDPLRKMIEEEKEKK